jgi:transposase
MHKLTINNNDKVILDVLDHFNKLPDGDFLQRLHAILLIASGVECSNVAKMFNRSRRTVHRWINAVNNGGIDALRNSRKSGRPAKLSEEEKEQLRRDLELEPGAFGYDQAEWDGVLVGRYIQERFNVRLRERMCQYLLRELGNGEEDKKRVMKKIL